MSNPENKTGLKEGTEAPPNVDSHVKGVEQELKQDEKTLESLKSTKKEKLPATAAQKWLTFWIYGGFNNTAVFLVSVVATYLTKAGGNINAEGKPAYGKVGQWFKNRGDWFKKDILGKIGIKDKADGTDGNAEMAKMIFFSFVDGSIMAVLVKLMEDMKAQWAKALDEKWGTKPENEAVYTQEPKQTWGSVLGGRLLTAGIVLPTAVALSKKHNGTSFNDILFNHPGEKFGKWLVEHTKIQKIVPNMDIPYLAVTSVFEAFYTSVCTIGLLVSSRFLAGLGIKKEEPVVETASATAKQESATKTPKTEPETVVAQAEEQLHDRKVVTATGANAAVPYLRKVTAPAPSWSAGREPLAETKADAATLQKMEANNAQMQLV